MTPTLAGLEPGLATAIVVLVTVVVVPVVTALVTSPRTPAAVRRGVPIALAAVGAVLVLLLRGDLHTLPATLQAWIMLAATILGGAQAIYSLMPATWKRLSASTGRRADRDSVMDGRDTPDA